MTRRRAIRRVLGHGLAAVGGVLAAPIYSVNPQMGTNLIIDHFIQDADWCQELLDVLRESDARVFMVRLLDRRGP
jgi:hypothetical protein